MSAGQIKELLQANGLDEDALCFSLFLFAPPPPLSHFNVGAIARGSSGSLYFGANIEFHAVSLQQTVHAEQSAIAHAWFRGEKHLRALTVNYTPFGHCRQFMNQLNSGTDLILYLSEPPAASLASYLSDKIGHHFAADNDPLVRGGELDAARAMPPTVKAILASRCRRRMAASMQKTLPLIPAAAAAGGINHHELQRRR